MRRESFGAHPILEGRAAALRQPRVPRETPGLCLRSGTLKFGNLSPCKVPPSAPLRAGNGAARHPHPSSASKLARRKRSARVFFDCGLESPRSRGSTAWRVLLALLLLLLGLGGSSTHAAGLVTNDHFETGNRALAQGHAAEALAAYAQIPPEQTSAALEFNRGLAHAQLGQLGHAIARLRRAARLAPRDREVDQALTQLRARVSGPVTEIPVFARFLGRLTLDEWAVLAGVAWWGWFALLFAGRVSGGMRQTVRGYTFAAGVVAVGLGGLLALSVWQRRLEPAVIATQANAAVRISPLDEAKVAFTVPDGAELRLQERREGWLRVEESSSGRFGWISAGAAAVVPVR
jgi:hypothetical protein